MRVLEWLNLFLFDGLGEYFWFFMIILGKIINKIIIRKKYIRIKIINEKDIKELWSLLLKWKICWRCGLMKIIIVKI